MKTNPVILSTKLKNAIRKTGGAAAVNLSFSLNNINVNGVKRGCSGFITNGINGSIVYVDTEESCLTNYKYICRYADSLHDFHGYRNHWTNSFESLVNEIIQMLQKTQAEAKDCRI